MGCKSVPVRAERASRWSRPCASGRSEGEPQQSDEAKPEVEKIRIKNKSNLQQLDTLPEVEVSSATAGFIPSPPTPRTIYWEARKTYRSAGYRQGQFRKSVNKRAPL